MCLRHGQAGWESKYGQATAAFASSNYDNDKATLTVPDRLTGFGSQYWYPTGAVGLLDVCGDPLNCDLGQNEPISDIRLGAHGAIAGTRTSANAITFTVTSAVWSSRVHRLVNRARTGELQTQYGDGTWHRVGTRPITTGRTGKATFTVPLPSRTWRFAVYSTPTSFDRVSTPITR